MTSELQYKQLFATYTLSILIVLSLALYFGLNYILINENVYDNRIKEIQRDSEYIGFLKGKQAGYDDFRKEHGIQKRLKHPRK